MRGERQSVREGSQTKVTDLREQFRTASKPAKSSKSAKHVKKPAVRNHSDHDKHSSKGGSHQDEAKDRRDLQAEKAERLAQVHHTTSLLKSKPQNNRAKEFKEPKKGGLMLQLVLVIVVAGGVAVALDPNILPREVRTLDWDGMTYQVEQFIENVTS